LKSDKNPDISSFRHWGVLRIEFK